MSKHSKHETWTVGERLTVWNARGKVAMCAVGSLDAPTPEEIARVHLIAAAPTMLETLKSLTNPDKLREAVMMTGAHLSHSQAMTMIEEDRLGIAAAIAKAEVA